MIRETLKAKLLHLIPPHRRNLCFMLNYQRHNAHAKCYKKDEDDINDTNTKSQVEF